VSDMDDQRDQLFSEASRRALAEASRQLTQRLQAHTEALLAMTGGPDDQTTLDEHNVALEELVEGWNEAVFEHTGTTPLLLEVDLEDEDEDDSAESEQVISVVSRFDLRISDPDALVAAGRAAQERQPAEEDEIGERETVETVEHAIYAISREQGEPWFALPGVDVVAGARAYVVPEPPFEPLEADGEDVVGRLGAPYGAVTHTEIWV
jgi:hypothetical protein